MTTNRSIEDSTPCATEEWNRSENRYEYVEYEGENDETRTVLHDVRNERAWIDSSTTVAVVR